MTILEFLSSTQLNNTYALLGTGGNASWNETRFENAFQDSFDLNITDLGGLVSSTIANVTYRNLSSTINEANISDLTHIGNETNRLQNITGYDCGAGEYAYGFQNNGTLMCREDTGGAMTNIFDQVLNLSSNVRFGNITSTGNLTMPNTNTGLCFGWDCSGSMYYNGSTVIIKVT